MAGAAAVLRWVVMMTGKEFRHLPEQDAGEHKESYRDGSVTVFPSLHLV